MQAPHFSYGIASFWIQGDMVIKAITLCLLAMSILSWTLILLRLWQTRSLHAAKPSANDFWKAHDYQQGLELLASYHSNNPFLFVALHAQEAAQNPHGSLHQHIPLSERLGECLQGAIDQALQPLQRGLPALASISATAPFIGLLGTVWGIYHALIGIASSTTQAHISQIAGPVGETLIMTALGLCVAIPASLFYNFFTRSNKAIAHELYRFARQLQAYFVSNPPNKNTTHF